MSCETKKANKAKKKSNRDRHQLSCCFWLHAKKILVIILWSFFRLFFIAFSHIIIYNKKKLIKYSAIISSPVITHPVASSVHTAKKQKQSEKNHFKYHWERSWLCEMWVWVSMCPSTAKNDRAYCDRLYKLLCQAECGRRLQLNEVFFGRCTKPGHQAKICLKTID